MRDSIGDWTYKWKSYKQIDDLVRRLGASIVDKNLASSVSDPEQNADLDIIGIVSINREEWLLTDLACNMIGSTSVPLYDTLGDEMVQMIMQQTEMKTLFGSDVCLVATAKLLEKTNSDDRHLKVFVTFDDDISAQL